MSADQSDSENPTAATSEEKWLPGKCKWFNVAKGWGFVVSEDGEHEVFVHQSALQMTGFRSLGDEEEIEYQATQSDKGLEATAVRAKGGGDCQGSHRRPGAKKKLRKVRTVSTTCMIPLEA
eukprot:TCALIF_04061-PA protein Name:"Similar to lin-28 Protein lin-28 homolog (Drosophila melanogaster)" AED:0.21 eAED:0.23 QI:224/0.66/0.75/1/0.33/0.25/4/0/120